MAGCLLASSAAMVGCLESDAWMLDPSVVGRWEHTPTTVPILERIEIIESGEGEFVDVTQVTPEDLIPEPVDYRTGPGDFLQIEIWDIIQPGTPALYDRGIDAQGTIDLPQLGRLRVEGLTANEVRQLIEQAVFDRGLVRGSPLVSVQVLGQRDATFSVFGAVPQPGRFGIPTPDFRLLEALIDAGGVSPLIKNVYVIRQVPLDDRVERGIRPETEVFEPTRPFVETETYDPTAAPAPGDADEAEDILDLIDELTGDDDGAGGALGWGPSGPATRISPGVLASGGAALRSGGARGVDRGGALAALADDDEPLIDLPDTARPTGSPTGPMVDGEPAAAPTPAQGPRRWVFFDGRWVQVAEAGPAAGEEAETGLPEGGDPLETGDPTAADLVTQRVLEVPTAPLLRGIARFNVVIRPGDVVHVPAPETGNVYVGGPGIARPGVYSLPATGRLTLQRLIVAAGGFSAIGIPERVDLVRMIGSDRQATIRLNVRAIAEGTQPDIFMKPDDMVNFGTNFWATPLAVIRNGFRMSYGFGFLLDRNFGNDVFGAPPSNVGGGN